MNPVSRGMRNAFRNSIRTFSIVVILGLSVGLGLAMLVARQAVQDKIISVKNSIGNTVTISPAGAQGFQGGGEPLTVDQLNKVSQISNVTSVQETLNDRLTSTTSNLVSAIEPGSLGRRQAGNSGVEFQGPPPDAQNNIVGENGNATFTRTFTPPVIVTGVNDLSKASVYGGATVSYTSGAAFDPNKDEAVAAVGSALATKNSLTVGSTFKMYDTDVKVVGIYDAGTAFANAGLVMPLATLQRLSSQTGSITSAVVTVNTLENVDVVTAAIKAQLGTAADVTNAKDSAKASLQPLESVKSISLYSVIGALVAGSVIILLTMMMIVRERRREIGVLKAIGSSNFKTMLQFMAEAVTLTALGLLVGLGFGVAAANPITNTLVTNSTNSSTASTTLERPRGPGRGLVGSFSTNSATSIKNIKTSVGVGTLGAGIGFAFLIALVGSAVPALLISKIRPADVMRAE